MAKRLPIYYKKTQLEILKDGVSVSPNVESLNFTGDIDVQQDHLNPKQINIVVGGTIYIAGENIGKYKCVRVNSSGQLIKCNSYDAEAGECIGLTTAEVLDGNPVVVINTGKCIDPSFSSFNVGDVLFVGLNGDLTNKVPPIGHYVQQIAIVTEINTIDIDMKTSVTRISP